MYICVHCALQYKCIYIIVIKYMYILHYNINIYYSTNMHTIVHYNMHIHTLCVHYIIYSFEILYHVTYKIFIV